MRDNPLKLFTKAPRGTPEAADERDTIIADLERAVAAERQHTAALRQAADDLRFKVEVLERSYGKQLDDARQRWEAAEGEVAALQAQIAELERIAAESKQPLKRQLSADGTINAMLDPTRWTQDPPSADRQQAVPEALASAAEDEPVEEMISPDLVFVPGQADD